MSSIWNDDVRVERMKQHWKDGISASASASKLSSEFGIEISRSAVIGKRHRMGLTSGRVPMRQYSARKKIAPTHSVPARPAPTLRQSALASVLERAPREPMPVADNPADYPDRVKLQDLSSSSCRWPIGDPQHEDFGFCGKNKVAGLPYCERHCRRAYQPAQPRVRSPKPVRVPTFADLEKV